MCCVPPRVRRPRGGGVQVHSTIYVLCTGREWCRIKPVVEVYIYICIYTGEGKSKTPKNIATVSIERVLYTEWFR